MKLCLSWSGLVAALIGVQGCTLCPTWHYDPPRVRQKTSDSSVLAAFDDRIIWRPLSEPIAIVVNGKVDASASVAIERLIEYGDIGDGSASPFRFENAYLNILENSTTPSWYLTKRQIREMRRDERFLVHQPNIFECAEIVLCKKSFPRRPSSRLARYQKLQKALAKAEDSLAACLAVNVECAREKRAVESTRERLNHNGFAVKVELILRDREMLVETDPAYRKSEALEKLETNYPGPGQAYSDDRILEWAAKAIPVTPNLPSATVPQLPQAVFISFSDTWLDVDFLKLNYLRFGAGNVPPSLTSPLLVPRFLVMMVQREASSNYDVKLLGIAESVLQIAH